MRATALLLAASLLAAAAAAQFGFPRRCRGGRHSPPTRRARLPDYDGGFRFCRVWFRNGSAGDGDGWYVDYPRADENLSIRLMELTKAPVTQDGEGNPYPVIVRLTDPSLFRCPFIMMSEPGGSYFSNEEAANLRAYLLKGGFLWVDDFWGSRAWRNWENQIGKALSPAEYPIVDLAVDHTMFRMLFPIDTLPQIPNVGLWRIRAAHVRARRRQRRAARARHPGSRRPRDGAHDAQHRLRRRLRARSRRPELLPHVLDQRLRDRHRRSAVRDDALTPSQ